MKVCSKCKTEKALDMFHKDKSKAFGVCGTCKECATARTRAYVAANHDMVKAKKNKAYAESPERAKERARKWGAENRDKTSARNRIARLRNKYGITPEQYEALGEAQKWCCAICGSKESGSKNSTNLSVDHCHKTNVIRGLLCHPCNAGIGYLREDASIMKNAINYLSEVKA